MTRDGTELLVGLRAGMHWRDLGDGVCGVAIDVLAALQRARWPAGQPLVAQVGRQ